MPRLRLDLGRAGVVHAVFTTRDDGDLRVDGPGEVLDQRRRALAPGPWTWLHQVHGADVVVVQEPGQHAGRVGDAAVTAVAGAPLAVHTADCAPVLVTAPEGVLGVIHAGWRGLVAGVVAETLSVMRSLGATDLRAVLGPCIRVGRYEFGDQDLELVAAVVGPAVRGRSERGRPALDLAGGVRAALRAGGVAEVHDLELCTAADGRFFSHRAHGDTARQALVAWRAQR